MVDKSQVVEALRKVVDPEIGRNIIDLNMLRSIRIQGKSVSVTVALTVPTCPLADKIKADVEDKIRGIEGVERAEVQFTSMTEEEREQIFSRFDPSKVIVKLPKMGIKHIVAVTSGKGGVGKSVVTGLLAVNFKRLGFDVGILDADLTGSSIAKIFRVDRVVIDSSGITPAVTNLGIKILSMNLILERDEDPVIWRGPIINKALKQLYLNAKWGSLDYLLIDLPPGTSDAPLTIFQAFPVDGIVVVTSPQELVGMVVGKAMNMAKRMRVQILGLIENMSYFECPKCGEKMELYGASKGDEVAKRQGIPFLGAMPVDPRISRLCDSGRIENYSSPLFTKIANKVVDALNETRVPPIMPPIACSTDLRKVKSLEGKWKEGF
ncbi:MAG: Mrp/NBP35 family ATP-binding protein [Candidatus Bathyarchaeia archaeon]